MRLRQALYRRSRARRLSQDDSGLVPLGEWLDGDDVKILTPLVGNPVCPEERKRRSPGRGVRITQHDHVVFQSSRELFVRYPRIRFPAILSEVIPRVLVVHGEKGPSSRYENAAELHQPSVDEMDDVRKNRDTKDEVEGVVFEGQMWIRGAGHEPKRWRQVSFGPIDMGTIHVDSPEVGVTCFVGEVPEHPAACTPPFQCGA